jgi:hypothetical protein
MFVLYMLQTHCLFLSSSLHSPQLPEAVDEVDLCFEKNKRGDHQSTEKMKTSYLHVCE